MSDPNWVSGPKLQTLSQSAACSKASSAGTSPLSPLQGKTPEPAGRICATKLLPQGHYVSPVYLPTVNHQPSGIKTNCYPAHLDPSPVSLRPEVPTKSRDTRKGKLPLVRGHSGSSWHHEILGFCNCEEFSFSLSEQVQLQVSEIVSCQTSLPIKAAPFYRIISID